MLITDLTQHDFDVINGLERTTSMMSLIATIFVTITYLTILGFQKPINRLIFYASVGNAINSVFVLFGRYPLMSNPGGALCHTQAFFIQEFLAADALWTFCMALNVYLTFFHSYTGEELRALEKWYLFGCYGIPFFPALALEFVKSARRGSIYGNATIWCWIGGEWEIFRLYFFYIPVWIIAVATMAIYIRAGKVIWSKSRDLHAIQKSQAEYMASPIVPQMPFLPPHTITNMETDAVAVPVQAHQGLNVPRNVCSYKDLNAFLVTGEPNNRRRSFIERATTRMRPISWLTGKSPSVAQRYRKHVDNKANKNLIAYTKVAGLFFIAMLMTWVPSTANRVYSVAHPGHINKTLLYISCIVLPLQGFWNAMIYIITGKDACKAMWRSLKKRKFRPRGLMATFRRAFSKELDRVPDEEDLVQIPVELGKLQAHRWDRHYSGEQLPNSDEVDLAVRDEEEPGIRDKENHIPVDHTAYMMAGARSAGSFRPADVGQVGEVVGEGAGQDNGDTVETEYRDMEIGQSYESASPLLTVKTARTVETEDRGMEIGESHESASPLATVETVKTVERHTEIGEPCTTTGTLDDFHVEDSSLDMAAFLRGE